MSNHIEEAVLELIRKNGQSGLNEQCIIETFEESFGQLKVLKAIDKLERQNKIVDAGNDVANEWKVVEE